jgi:peptide methionine sulfoxide reductase MsrB
MSDTKTSEKITKTGAEWRRELTPLQYAVLREKATERPFSGEYEHEHPAAISGTSSMTAPARTACATASIRRR